MTQRWRGAQSYGAFAVRVLLLWCCPLAILVNQARNCSCLQPDHCFHAHCIAKFTKTRNVCALGVCVCVGLFSYLVFPAVNDCVRVLCMLLTVCAGIADGVDWDVQKIGRDAH
jgi:hypothetical protein